MKNLILVLSVVSTSAFAACPDLSGVYMSRTSATSSTSSNGSNSTVTTPKYEYMMISQTGCEHIVIKDLKESGLSNEVDMDIGTPDYVGSNGTLLKAAWKNNKLTIAGKPDAVIQKLEVGFSRYDDGVIEVMEYSLSVPTGTSGNGSTPGTSSSAVSSSRDVKVWERIQ